MDENENWANRRVVSINRPAFSQKEFDSKFSTKAERNGQKGSKIRTILAKLSPINLLGTFTILSFITEYNFKKYLITDMLSGITVGVMHIPSSLAYGALTSLNPVHGLYTSFFTGITYIFFGTSKHLSVGTFAVTSLIVYSTISRLEAEYPELAFPNSFENSTSTEGPSMEFKIKVATGLAFWCGVIQIIFSLLKFGSISKFLSQPLLRGFTTAAAFHVFSSQMKHIFGIYYVNRKKRKFFKLIFLYLRLFQNIESINWAAFIFSIVCIVFLYLTRTQINERFKTQLKNIPLPIELFVIIVGTVISNLAELNKNYAMTVVGNIPKGFPEPQLPELNLFMDMLLDAVILSVIAYATSLSVSDLFARKHKYKIDSNKEFFALGASNIAGSFFQSFVSCGSLSRTVVADSSGGKTQLVTIIASSVVLTVMLWLGPFLEQLPKACLGSIIVAALLNLLLQVRDLPYYWRLDRLDFATWIITFISTIILDVDFGLCIGFLTVLFLNTYRTQKLEVNVQGRVKDFELYRQVDKYLVTEQESIRVVCPNQSIYFVTSDIFKNQLYFSCPSKSNMITDLSLLENCKINYGCGNGGTEKSDIEIRIDDTENDTLNNSKKFETIIINFSNVQFVDEAGCNCLKEIIKDYESDNIQILFACCNETVLDYFKRMKLELDERIFLTVQDAVSSKLC